MARTECPKCNKPKILRNRGKILIELRIRQEHETVCEYCGHKFKFSKQNTTLRDEEGFVWGKTAPGRQMVFEWVNGKQFQ